MQPRRFLPVAAGAAILSIGSCAAFADGPRWIAPRTNETARLQSVEIVELLAQNRLGPEENIKALSLHRDTHNAILLVQVRHREPNHYHADSNITVLMLEGQGVLHTGNQSFDLAVGDSALVPRGAPHYFVNRGNVPAAALVIYAPPPSKNDRVVIKTEPEPTTQ